MKRKLMSALLIVAMLVTMMPQNLLIVSAARSGEGVVSGENANEGMAESTGDVGGTGTGEDVVTPENSLQTFAMRSGTAGDVTRIEWLAALVDVFDMTVDADNYPDNYYSDLSSDSDIYRTVMVATEFGLVDVEAGDPLRPDDAATREFVAHSFNICMGYMPDGEVKYTFTEVDSVTYPDDIQIAIDKKWFALSNGAFLPQTGITTAEKDALIAIAKASLSDSKVDENYHNQYTVRDGVIVLPESVQPLMTDDNELTLYNCTTDLKAGEIFIALSAGFPIAYKAVNVTASDDTVVVAVESAELEDAFESIDIQGVIKADMTQVQVLHEDAQITYIVGGTSIQNYMDGIECYSLEEVGDREVNAVLVSQEMDIPENLRQMYALDKGEKAEISAVISDVEALPKYEAGKGAYLGVSGKVTFTCNVGINVLEALGFNKILYEIPIAGVGRFKVTMEADLGGEVSLNLVEDFSLGVYASIKDGFRMVQSFEKRKFTIQAEAKAKLGIKISAGVDVGFIKGELYAKVGAEGSIKAITYTDGKLPVNCTHQKAYLYASVGASIKAKIGFETKIFSWDLKVTFWEDEWGTEYVLWNEKNSPVKVFFHYEDGKSVSRCTREKDNSTEDGKVNSNTSSDSWKYYTPIDSQYGYSGGNSGIDSAGKPFTIFDYTLDKNDNATITGYRGNVSALNIPETLDEHKVVEIGSKVFKDNKLLYMVVVPDSVTIIGSQAFQNCTNLSQITLSKSLKSLEYEAFGNCDALTEIEIPKSLEKGGKQKYASKGPFFDCDLLKTVRFETGTTEVAECLFAGCTGLEKIVIPNTVTVIEEYAFAECTNLQQIMLPNSLTAMSNNAFENCVSLKDIFLSDSISSIGDFCFRSCTSLEEVVLPKNLESLGAGAFEQCVTLETVSVPKTLKTVKCTYAGGYSVLIGSYVTGSGPLNNKGPFAGCYNLNNIVFEEGITYIPDYLFAHCTGIEKIKIPDTVTGIGIQTFDQCSNLKELYLSTNIISIGECAFGNCEKLEEIQLPDCITNLGDYSFAKCNKLCKIILPKQLKKLGKGAFCYCDSLSSVWIPKSIESVGEVNGGGPFLKCTSLKTISLEQGIEIIPAYIFAKCDAIEKIEIPNSVTEIGEHAFANCKKMTEISIPNSVGTIYSHAFDGCSSLQAVTVPNNVTAMGAYIFSDCTGLETVQLPQGRKNIGEGTFQNCTSLKTIILPETVTAIRKNAFQNSGLTQIVLPDMVEIIEENAFRDCVNLTSVTCGNKLVNIEKYAFYNCEALAAINLPDSVTSVGTYCFAECEMLKDVHLGTGLTMIPSYAFNLCPALEKIIIPYRVTTINSNAFTNCTKLTEVTIPRATKTIGSNTFSYPTKMTIYGITGTYAETYAKEIGAAFVNREVPVTSMTFNQTQLKVTKGTSAALILSVSPSDFTDTITWRSSDTSVATVTDGTVKAVAIGTVKISALAGDTGAVKAECEIEVVQPVTSISLDKTSLVMEGGDTYTLTATVKPDTAYDKSVTWSSSDENVAVVSETGVVTALQKGTATITVTAQDGSGVSRTCKVTVNSTMYLVESLEELQSKHPYENNTNEVWGYTLAGAESLKVTFSSDTAVDEGYDFIYIYDSTGKEVGKYTGSELSGRTVEIPGDQVRIKLITDDAITGYGFKVDSVVPAGAPVALESIALSQTSLSLAKGETASLQVTFDPKNTTVDRTVTWSSSNENVVVVQADGTVTAVGVGTATITAKVADKTAACQVTVRQNAEGLTLSSEIMTLHVGETARLSYQILPIDSVVESVEWSSSSEDTVTVRGMAGLDYAEVKAVGPGTAEIVLTVDGMRAVCQVTVEDKIVLHYQDGSERMEEISGTYGKPLTGLEQITPSRDGYLFVGWYTQPGGQGEHVTQDTILTNQWALYAYWRQVTEHFWVQPVGDQMYTGKAIKPAVIVYDGDVLLQEKIDYTISYKNNTKANNASNAQTAPKIIVKGKGNYSGKAEVTFKILPQDIEGTDFAIDPMAVAYNAAKVQKPIPSVLWKGKKLKNKTDFVVSYPDSTGGASEAYKAPGTYSVKVHGTGNYTGERTITLTITQQNLMSKASVVKPINQEYADGAPVTPNVTVKMKKEILTQGVDYELAYENNCEIGTASVIITGKGQYCGVKRIQFKIVGTSIAKAQIEGIESRNYDGSAQTQKFTVSLNGISLTEGVDYVVSYSNNINVGTAKLTVNGIGKYTGTIKKSFKITAFDMRSNAQMLELEIGGQAIAGTQLDSVKIADSYVKGGSRPAVSVNEVKWNRQLIEGKDFTVTYSNNKTVTTSETNKLPTITIKGKGNYAGVFTKTFTIHAKTLNDAQMPVSMSVPDKGVNEKAGGYISKPVLTDVDGKVLKEGLDYSIVEYTVQNQDGEVKVLDQQDIVTTVGTEITVSVIGKGAYAGTQDDPSMLSAVYYITERSFTGLKIASITKTYSGDSIILDAADFFKENGDSKVTIKEGNLVRELYYGEDKDFVIVEGSYKNNIKKGTASVTVKGCGKYGGTAVIKFKITQKKLSFLDLFKF